MSAPASCKLHADRQRRDRAGEFGAGLLAPAASCSHHMASSSDDELKEDEISAKIVRADHARMTLELVVPASMLRQLITLDFQAEKIKITIPSDVVPGRKFRLDVVPAGAGTWCLASADAPTPARSTDGSECSRRTAGSSDNELDAVNEHSPGYAHSSESRGPVDEVRGVALQLCRWHEEAADDADFQRARARDELLELMFETIASDQELGNASTKAGADIVLEYLDVFQQVRTAAPEAAEIILAALQSFEGLSPGVVPPLEAIRGQDVVVRNDTHPQGMQANFVGFDSDSGRRADCLPTLLNSNPNPDPNPNPNPTAGAGSRCPPQRGAGARVTSDRISCESASPLRRSRRSRSRRPCSRRICTWWPPTWQWDRTPLAASRWMMAVP